MACCPNCFSDDWLIEFIGANSVGAGECDYCGAADAPLIEVGQLTQFFRNMLSMYQEADSFENGETLIWLIQWRWSVFNEGSLSEDAMKRLLEDIANDDWDDDDGVLRIDASDLYMSVFRSPFHETNRDAWEQFCFDVRRSPGTEIPFSEHMGEEFALSEMRLATGSLVYRARVGFTESETEECLPWSGELIGAPPQNKAVAGRANTEGQRVLYVADDEKTAISEVRPALGYCVSLASLRLKRDCRILDLTKELPPINPFTSDSFVWEIEIRGLLAGLSDEMSRPLERTDDMTTYVPYQKLSDFIRASGFDGIRYPSALNPEGSSIVFFDPEIAEVVDSKLVKITEVNFSYSVEN